MRGRVVLINGIFNTLRMSEPIGICSIAATLRAKGHEAYIVEPRLMDLDVMAITAYAIGLEPTYVGISTFSFEKNKVFELAECIKKTAPHIFIAVGGLGPTLTPEIYLDGCQYIDAVLSGEGENISVRLLELLLESGYSWKECPGVIYREDGKIKHGPVSEKIHNLDELPYMARDILQLNIEKYGQKYVSASIMGSRGCFGDCSYCWIAEAQEKHPGLRYRLRSIESIVGEIEHVVNKYGITDFSFEDDNFLPLGKAGIDRAKEFRDLIKSKLLKITFFMQTRPDTLTDLSLKYLKEAGLKKLFIGIEAISKEDLDIYNKKHITADSIEQTLKMLKRHGFDPDVGRETDNRLRFGYIAFHQGTTLPSIKASVAFFERNKLTPKRLLTRVNYFDGDIDIKKKLIEKGLLSSLENDDKFTHADVGLVYKYIKKYAENVLPYRENIRSVEKHVFRTVGHKKEIAALCKFRENIDQSFYDCFNLLIITAENTTDIIKLEQEMTKIVSKSTEILNKSYVNNNIEQQLNQACEKYNVKAWMHNIYW